jgi:Ca2+-binding RTX toxin-like protein
VNARFAIGCLVCLFVTAPAAAASGGMGTPSVVNSFAADGDPAGTELLGGPGANRVTVDIDRAAGEYVISDTAGVAAGNDCTSISPQTARCTRHSSRRAYFRARLRGDDDVLQMISPVPQKLELRGGEGADKLLAGTGSDRIFGGEGPDTLTGRAGRDRLFGGRGRDRFIAGNGQDRLHADDGDRDRAINCGLGDDVVFVDRDEDPKLIRCERVRFGRGA